MEKTIVRYVQCARKCVKLTNLNILYPSQILVICLKTKLHKIRHSCSYENKHSLLYQGNRELKTEILVGWFFSEEVSYIFCSSNKKVK